MAGGNGLLVTAATILVAVVVGLLVYVCAVRPLGAVSDVNSARHLSVIVSTIGFSLILQNGALLLFGGYPRPFPHFIDGSPLIITVLDLAIAASVVIVVAATLRYSRAGLRLRALSDNPELALCTGIRTEYDKVLSVAISSALAGVAAVLICQQIGVVSPFLGDVYGFKALIIVLVGGLGSMSGVAVISLGLGLTEAFAVQWFDSSYRDAIAFGLLIAILLVKYRRTRIGQIQ
jgi:branched-chain amino acid transport system permease protein